MLPGRHAWDAWILIYCLDVISGTPWSLYTAWSSYLRRLDPCILPGRHIWDALILVYCLVVIPGTHWSPRPRRDSRGLRQDASWAKKLQSVFWRCKGYDMLWGIKPSLMFLLVNITFLFHTCYRVCLIIISNLGSKFNCDGCHMWGSGCWPFPEHLISPRRGFAVPILSVPGLFYMDANFGLFAWLSLALWSWLIVMLYS